MSDRKLDRQIRRLEKYVDANPNDKQTLDLLNSLIKERDYRANYGAFAARNMAAGLSSGRGNSSQNALEKYVYNYEPKLRNDREFQTILAEAYRNSPNRYAYEISDQYRDDYNKWLQSLPESIRSDKNRSSMTAWEETGNYVNSGMSFDLENLDDPSWINAAMRARSDGAYVDENNSIRYDYAIESVSDYEFGSDDTAKPKNPRQGLSSGRSVQSTGTPRNRITRRTQAPRQLREGLSSGMQRTKLIFPINDGSRDYISRRVAGKDYVKAVELSANRQFSPGGEWILDGKKFLSLFTDQDGNQMDTGSIAQLLGVNRGVITDIGRDGNGVPESLFNDIAMALYAGAIGETGRAGRLDPRTVDEYFPVVASGTNQYDYAAALGTKLWGFDYAPYWHDLTEERTVTAIGQSKENVESAKRSFSAALEDNEVLASFRPAFEPIGFEDDYGDVIPQTPPTESVNTTYVQQGALIPEDQILDKSNYQLAKLAEALGADPDNPLEVLQAILDAGINVKPSTIKAWEAGGVPTEAVDHLIVSGAIPSAAAVFGPEFAQFDEMQDRHDALEKLFAAMEKAGIPATAIATITNAKYSLKAALDRIAKDKEKNRKRIEGTEKLSISGPASKFSTAEKRQLLNSFNAIARKNGSTELTMEELFGTKRGGLSSGGKRFVTQTPQKRMTTARIQAKYPNLQGAYARVSDIPTPERLNNKGLSSGREQEIYATITANLVESMEKAIANGIEWEAPWRQGRMFPRNGMTRTRYKGINILTLMLAQEEKNYEKPIWGTFDNWKAAGGSVKKGEKGTPIIFAGYIDVEDPKNPGETKTRRTLRSYYVFNLDQVEGVDREKFNDGMEELDSQLRVADVDQIATALGVDLRHSGDSAYFSPLEDKIVMPPFSEFKSPEDYYSTLMHEIVHWTGGRSRLDRPNMNLRNSPEYAFEELIAEIGAAYMMGILGLSVEPRGDHAHYLGHWVQKLKDDPEAIQKAVTAAQKAANWIIENVPSLKEATEKANKAAEEASAEAKKLSDEAKEAKGAASTSRRPNTRRPSTRRRQ